MDKLVEIMMKLIKSEVCSTPLDVVAPISLSDAESQRLYALSKSHDLAHIVASALRKNNISVPKDTETKFQKQMFSAVFRYENINYEYNRICGVLERAQIQFVPLKGSVIRKYYAEPWMRTSCDIDILVHEADLEKATEIIAGELGYEIGQKGRHDVPFNSQTGVHLELHYSLIEDSEIRRIFTLYYIKGYAWRRVARELGYADESVPRKKHDRYLLSTETKSEEDKKAN